MDGLFTGYASLFGVPDLGGDTVAPGAFAASLGRRGAGGVRMLWQHDPAEPIGLWLSLVEDARGLRVAGRLNPGVQRAREIDALMREGALDGLSIGFRTVRAAPERGGRRLAAIDLWEISLVTFPLQPGARVTERASNDLASNDLASNDRVSADLARVDSAGAALAARLHACARRMRERPRPVPARAARPLGRCPPRRSAAR